MSTIQTPVSATGLEIAVIGIAGRFPGAENLTAFWNNLSAGVESISFLLDEDLKKLGVDETLLKDPNYVKAAGGILKDKEFFDAAFFEYTPREAELMDPQVRIFLECVFEALNDAGYDPASYQGLIGLYAGASSSFYWQAKTLLSGKMAELGEFAASNLANKDLLSTHVSYKLDLKGPSVTVQTTCSTSLVAIHLACQAILNGECDIALAGGVSVNPMPPSGYIYEDGMIRSPDGHCRAFDAQARGTIGGEGAGVVVLKSLQEALVDRDNIHAVIRGCAVNNDGRRKLGYTAPSIEGQREVIRTAQRVADVKPESITYIEAHGTGTDLGDPIEIEALKQAFHLDARQSCAIGSVKTNIGHLDAAAGVAGFIKTVLALKHKQIPPSLHFERPNQKTGIEESPFFVSNKLVEWKNGTYPLRAGVSSFGIGGTNAHVVLEESPARAPSSPGRKWQMICFSARDESALTQTSRELADYLRRHPVTNLADVAYTLQTGRKAFEYRKMLVCSDVDEAITILSSRESERLRSFFTKESKRPVILMFPGQGSQYENMGRGLYLTESVFRETMNEGFEILHASFGLDAKSLLYPEPEKIAPAKSLPAKNKSASARIDQTEITQPLLFMIEYALAKQLISWGIQPSAMIGHSIGEYVAACLAGVFTFSDALKLVALRGRLMQKLPSGSMIGVPLSREQLTHLLTDNISLAAVNGLDSCVLSGPAQAIESLKNDLRQTGCQFTDLHTSHAFHSGMMEPVLQEFEKAVKDTPRKKPALPFISNVTGSWITGEQATDPAYWASHLRRTVRFYDGLQELAKTPSAVFVEAGPGSVLTTFARRTLDKANGYQAINLLRHPQETEDDEKFLLDKLGQLWLYGVKIDWRGFYADEQRNRLPLPPYPFQRQRFWIDEKPLRVQEAKNSKHILAKKPEIAEWFYVPSWTRSVLAVNPTNASAYSKDVLVFMHQNSFCERFVQLLEQKGYRPIVVKSGSEFKQEGDRIFQIHPNEANDYQLLFAQLSALKFQPNASIHLWSIIGEEQPALDHLGFFSLIYLAKAVSKQNFDGKFYLTVLTNNLCEVIRGDSLKPESATVLGPIKVIPQEFPYIECRSIDISLSEFSGGDSAKLTDKVVTEVLFGSSRVSVAYHGGHRWVQNFLPVRLDESFDQPVRLRKGGVYLIIGGVGDIGLTVAEHLARETSAKLVLIRRRPFPQQCDWQAWLTGHSEDDDTSTKIRILQALEKSGAEVMIMSADVANFDQMQMVMAAIDHRFGRLDGVIHAAGEVSNSSARCPIDKITETHCRAQFSAKVDGLLNLEKLLAGRRPDFCLLISSLSAVLGGFGFATYSAANIFMDSYIQKLNRNSTTRWISVNLDGWRPRTLKDGTRREGLVQDFGIESHEGPKVFQRILSWDGAAQVIVSTGDLEERVARWVELKSENDAPAKTISHPRPNLSNSYVAPRNKLEASIAEIWSNLFGFQQIGVNDDFFELGGDSLKVITAISKIHKALNVNISIADFFKSPTIKRLVESIAVSEPSEFCPIKPVEKKEYYPLSSVQKGLYFIQQLKPENISHNLNKVVILKGQLDAEKLSTSFKRLIERHESFRTSFLIAHNELVQRVHDLVDFEVEFFAAKPESAAKIVEDFIRPFDLSVVPLLRVGCVELNETEHLLMLDMHHIVSDAISDSILVNDIVAIYNGAALPELRLQYKDYSEWQNSPSVQEMLKKQESYWLTKFASNIPVLNLPLDFSRPAVQDFEGETINFMVGKDLNDQINGLLKDTETTLYMFFAAVTNILLARYSGQEDIIIGTEVVGRRHADLENIIGVFVNQLAIRNQPNGSKTFREFLMEVKTTAIEAFENQDYQFEQLVAKLGLQGNYSKNPLFTVVVGVEQKYASRETDDPATRNGLKIKPYAYERKIALRDLRFGAMQLDDGIAMSLTFATSLFKITTCEKMCQRLLEIIEQVIKNPDMEIQDIAFSYNLIDTKVISPREYEGDFAF